MWTLREVPEQGGILSVREHFGVSVKEEHSELSRYAFLFFISCALYLKSVSFQFLPTWDDGGYLLNNPVVHSLSFDNVKAMFTTAIMGNYAPLHMFSYAVEYRLWGDNPLGYHLVNVVLHAANACGVYRIVNDVTHDRGGAFCAAILFAVHPVNVEKVAWISESKTLFSSLFLLAAFSWYMRYHREKRGLFYVLAILCFLVGMLFKVSIATLPFAILAYEHLVARVKISWARIAPFFAISLVVGSAAVWAQLQRGSVDQGILSTDVLLGQVYPTMAPTLWKYLELLFWPVHLSGYYETTLYHSFLETPVMFSLAAFVVLVTVIVWKGNAQVRFWSVWFSAFLLPAANIVPLPVYYADRYLYASGIGVFALAGLAAMYAWEKREEWKYALRPAFPVLAALLAVMSFGRLDVWRNELVFWEDTVRKSPNLFKPHLNLGVTYEKAGRLDEAEREYRASLAIHSTEQARYNLGMVLMKKQYRQKSSVQQ